MKKQPNEQGERCELQVLIREAIDIMTIVYAGNFPAGIESFLIRADRALLKSNEALSVGAVDPAEGIVTE